MYFFCFIGIFNGRTCFVIINFLKVFLYYHYFKKWSIILCYVFPDITITINDWLYYIHFSLNSIVTIKLILYKSREACIMLLHVPM